MQIKTDKQDDIVLCTIEGDIDINSSPDIKKAFDGLIKDKEAKIIVNLENVPYIDSSGLATLVEMFKRTKTYGGLLKLSNLSEKVRGLFEITKLEKIFAIYDTVENARGDF